MESASEEVYDNDKEHQGHGESKEEFQELFQLWPVKELDLNLVFQFLLISEYIGQVEDSKNLYQTVLRFIEDDISWEEYQHIHYCSHSMYSEYWCIFDYISLYFNLSFWNLFAK